VSASIKAVGSIQLGYDATPCTSANEGAQRYNSGVMEFCNGILWGPIGGIPAKTIAFFNLASCPAGWTPVSSAQGRYLVGLPAPGTLGGTAGSELGDQENRPAGRHNHTATDSGHTHTYPKLTSGSGGLSLKGPFVSANSYPATNTGYANITVANNGTTTGTNAPYIQFLVCSKD